MQHPTLVRGGLRALKTYFTLALFRRVDIVEELY
jgi:hypothetical protein